MNKKTVALFLTICFFCKAQSQQIYIKAYTQYHLSISSEASPQYFELGYFLPAGSSFPENFTSAIKKLKQF